MNDLLWQLPLLAVVLLLFGRVVQMFLRAKKRHDEVVNSILNPPPLTLERVAKELVLFEDTTNGMLDVLGTEADRRFDNVSRRLAEVERRLKNLEVRKDGDSDNNSS